MTFLTTLSSAAPAIHARYIDRAGSRRLQHSMLPAWLVPRCLFPFDSTRSALLFLPPQMLYEDIDWSKFAEADEEEEEE